MRKLFLSVVVGLVVCLVGCGKSEGTKTFGNEEAQTNSTTVSGSFTVEVIDVIPDYCFDDVTPCVAIVAEFQSYPFTLFVGEEIGSQLKAGEIYVFDIEPITVNYPKETLAQMNLSSIVWELSDFQVIDARLAEENEMGMESLQLTFSDEF